MGLSNFPVAPDGTKAGDRIPGAKGAHCFRQFCYECKAPTKVTKAGVSNDFGYCKYCRGPKPKSDGSRGLVARQRHGRKHTNS